MRRVDERPAPDIPSRVDISMEHLPTLTATKPVLRVDLAIRLVLRDAARFKLEEVGSALCRFEQRYQTKFAQFEQAFQSETLPQASSYEVERDYLEWEGLLSRKQRVEKVLGELE